VGLSQSYSPMSPQNLALDDMMLTCWWDGSQVGRLGGVVQWYCLLMAHYYISNHLN